MGGNECEKKQKKRWNVKKRSDVLRSDMRPTNECEENPQKKKGKLKELGWPV